MLFLNNITDVQAIVISIRLEGPFLKVQCILPNSPQAAPLVLDQPVGREACVEN